MAQRIKKADQQIVIPEVQDYIACGWGEWEEDPVLARQRLAGEEDQSQPGWDQGA